jgi:hypothetical protein
LAIKHYSVVALALEVAAATDWFYVQPVRGSNFARKHPLAYTVYYWCRRRDNGTYDLFSGSDHGPYITGVSEAEMKEGVKAIRQNGRLWVIKPDEKQKLEEKLQWFLTR